MKMLKMLRMAICTVAEVGELLPSMLPKPATRYIKYPRPTVQAISKNIMFS